MIKEKKRFSSRIVRTTESPILLHESGVFELLEL